MASFICHVVGVTKRVRLERIVMRQGSWRSNTVQRLPQRPGASCNRTKATPARGGVRPAPGALLSEAGPVKPGAPPVWADGLAGPGGAVQAAETDPLHQSLCKTASAGCAVFRRCLDRKSTRLNYSH